MPSTPRSNQNRRTSSNSARTVGVLPVEVGLLRGEQVQVPLAGGAVRVRWCGSRCCPGTRTPSRSGICSPCSPLPGRNQNSSRSGEPGPAASAAWNHACWSETWFGTMSMIVRMPSVARLGDERLGLREGAEGRVDVAVVGDVVAAVGQRREYQGVNQIASTPRSRRYGSRARMPGEVAGAVAVPVGEAARVDLVDHRAAPPLRVGLRLRLRHSRLVSRGPPSTSPGPGCPAAPRHATRTALRDAVVAIQTLKETTGSTQEPDRVVIEV